LLQAHLLVRIPREELDGAAYLDGGRRPAHRRRHALRSARHAARGSDRRDHASRQPKSRQPARVKDKTTRLAEAN
jgi:hypothetical protein